MSRKRHKKKKIDTLVDVLIPVYGQFEYLTRCLNALPAAMGEITYQTYIFDNNSPIEEAANFYPSLDKSIRVIKNKTNIGFPGACNRLVGASRSPLVFLLNSDVILSPGSVDLLVRTMDDPSIGVTGMRLSFPDDAQDPGRPAGRIQHIGLTTNIRGEVIHSFIGWTADHPRVMVQREVFAVTGAAMMTRRNIWRDIRGLREEYGMGTFEEVDFQMSVREMGYNIVVEPRALGTHYVGATLEKYGMGYNLQNNFRLFHQRWGDKIQWWQYRQS